MQEFLYLLGAAISLQLLLVVLVYWFIAKRLEQLYLRFYFRKPELEWIQNERYTRIGMFFILSVLILIFVFCVVGFFKCI